MYDTGRTMQRLLLKLHELGAKKVEVCIAFHKKQPKNLELNYWPEYIGFFIPDKFVIGYGLDYNEKFRDIMHLCVLNEVGIEKYKV
jgi:hypoxanthine phosphoribosyltransferase